MKSMCKNPIHLSIAYVRSSSSSIVPYASYVSSIMANIDIAFVKNLKEGKYWGSKYTPNDQTKLSTSLFRAKGSFVAKSKPFHHLKHISTDDENQKGCQISSFLVGVRPKSHSH